MSSRPLRTWALRVGIVAFLLSWFLPITPRGHSGFADDAVPGWMAFTIALLAPWSGGGARDWGAVIPFSASALTSLVMAAALVALLFKFKVGWRWALALILAGTLNGWWIVYLRGGLGIGYYLWLTSFFLVGLGLSGSRSAVTQ